MREFIRRRPATAHLSVIDCRAITPAAYSPLAPSTRPREGWSGYPAVPFGYDSQANGEMEGKAVLKTFWSWRRVGVPKGWKEALTDSERGSKGIEGDNDGRAKARAEGPTRRGTWWMAEEGDDAGGSGCLIM